MQIKTLDGFIGLSEAELNQFVADFGLAMDLDDIKFCQNYFISEQRDPTITEIRMIDTYWSDHCRHTTFSTELKNIEFEDGYYRAPIETSYQSYLDTREELFKGRTDKFVCLMDLAIMGMRKLREDGKLDDMEVSDALFKAVEAWGKERGMTEMVGPLGV